MQPCQKSKCWENDRNKLAELEQRHAAVSEQLRIAQNSAIKNADKLTLVVNAISDNANGYPEDTVYTIACIVGIEVD